MPPEAEILAPNEDPHTTTDDSVLLIAAPIDRNDAGIELPTLRANSTTGGAGEMTCTGYVCAVDVPLALGTNDRLALVVDGLGYFGGTGITVVRQ